jgi:hypothetical protein
MSSFFVYRIPFHTFDEDSAMHLSCLYIASSVDFTSEHSAFLPMITLFGPLTSVFSLLILLPIMLTFIFTMLFLPSVLPAGSKPLSAAKALYSYLMQGFGVALMTIGALPALHSVLSNAQTSTSTYIGLLVLFAVGGLVFLLHEHLALSVDEPSRSIPHAVYFFVLKAFAFVVTVGGALGLILAMLFGYANTPTWWVTPALLLGYGLLLSFCTRFELLGPAPVKAPAPAKPATAPMPVATPMPMPTASRPTIVGAKPMIMPSNRLTMTPGMAKPAAPVASKPAAHKPAKKPAHKKSSKKTAKIDEPE